MTTFFWGEKEIDFLRLMSEIGTRAPLEVKGIIR